MLVNLNKLFLKYPFKGRLERGKSLKMKKDLGSCLLKAALILLPLQILNVATSVIMEKLLNALAKANGWRPFHVDPTFMVLLCVFGFLLWKIEELKPQH